MASENEDLDLQIKAAQLALALHPTAEANYLVGSGLQAKSWMATGNDKKQLAMQAVEAFRKAIRLSN